MLNSYRFFAALVAVSLSFHAHAENTWLNPGTGDWAEGLNWSEGVPTTNAIVRIDNGGTAQITNDVTGPSQVHLGPGLGGSLEHLSGVWRNSTVYFDDPLPNTVFALAATAGEDAALVAPTPSRLLIGGDAIAELESLQGERQNVSLTGGSLEITSLYLYGNFEQTGGSLQLPYEFLTFATSSFLLSGDSTVTVHDARYGGPFHHVAGTLETTYTSDIVSDGEYRISGGTADLGILGLFGGKLVVDGGTAVVDRLNVSKGDIFSPRGFVEVSSGTLALKNSITPGGAPLQFFPGPWTLDVQAGMASLWNASMPDVSQSTLITAPETLTILPAGIQVSNFAAANIQGIVHTAGTPLVISENQTAYGMGDIPDPLTVEGALIARDTANAASVDPGIHVLDGIRVMPGGAARLGTGWITVTDDESGLFGGDLRANRVTVGLPGQPGKFSVTAGLFDDEDNSTASPVFFIGHEAGATGRMEISGGKVRARDFYIGVQGTGAVRQTGGEVELGYSTGSSTAVGLGGRYELEGGVLDAYLLALAGEFIQTGGKHVVRDAQIGHPDASGIYELKGGENVVEDILSFASWPNSQGTYIVSGDGKLDARRIHLNGPGDATLRIEGGGVTADELLIGWNSDLQHRLEIDSATATVEVRQRVRLGNSARLAIEESAALTLAGVFELTSTDPTRLAGFSRLTLEFSDTGAAYRTLEVGSADLGEDPTGYIENFSLGGLLIGGETPARVRLANLSDNQPGPEALYVRHLAIGADSFLDLNGINLYYGSLSMDPGATLILGGGRLRAVAVPVPEPAAAVLIALASVLLWSCRGAKSKRQAMAW